MALENQQTFDQRGILAINIMASPGAGKTSTILRTIEGLSSQYKIAVIEGDTAPVTIDADKINARGIPVTQSIPAATAIWTLSWFEMDWKHSIWMASTW
jgi:hydrogenase nickel incorporation protein HypB